MMIPDSKTVREPPLMSWGVKKSLERTNKIAVQRKESPVAFTRHMRRDVKTTWPMIRL